MLAKSLVFSLLILHTFPEGLCSSLLCGSAKEVELGESVGAAAALALALLRPPAAPHAACQLRLTAPDAAAFTARLIDVKESVSDWERGQSEVQAPAPVAGAPGRKWGARSAAAQDTAAENSSAANNTDACKLLVYIGDAKSPIWRLSLCGGNAAAVAARAGTKLLPPKIRIVWNPPTTPYHHTEKLRLVITAVNSGAACNNESQFVCGMTGLCISSYLVCDGIKHCPGGEDENSGACSQRRDPPLLELTRRFAARNQELLGLDQAGNLTKPSVISVFQFTVKVTEGEQKSDVFKEINKALRPYEPWSYMVIGIVVCASILVFCLFYECCCQKMRPLVLPRHIPPACVDLSPTVTVTAASQQMFTQSLPASPPEYEPPPSYSSLFPRAFKSSPTPVPHCSHQQPDAD